MPEDVFESNVYRRGAATKLASTILPFFANIPCDWSKWSKSSIDQRIQL